MGCLFVWLFVFPAPAPGGGGGYRVSKRDSKLQHPHLVVVRDFLHPRDSALVGYYHLRYHLHHLHPQAPSVPVLLPHDTMLLVHCIMLLILLVTMHLFHMNRQTTAPQGVSHGIQRSLVAKSSHMVGSTKAVHKCRSNQQKH